MYMGKHAFMMIEGQEIFTTGALMWKQRNIQLLITH